MNGNNINIPKMKTDTLKSASTKSNMPDRTNTPNNTNPSAQNNFRKSGNLGKLNANNAFNDDNNSQEGKDPEKEKIKEVGKEAAIKAGSAALQAVGVPKPIGEKALKKLADNPNVDKIIDKKVDEIHHKYKKAKTLAIAGIIVLVFFSLMQFVLIYSVMFAPVAAVGEALDAVKSGWTAFWTGAGNFFTGYGWVDNDKAETIASNRYYDKLNGYVDEYEKSCGTDTSINGELITATIFFDQMFNMDNEYNNPNENEEDADLDDVTESTGGRFSYKGKTNKVDVLIDRIWRSKDSCSLDYYSYRNYLIDNYINGSNYDDKVIDNFSGKEEIADIILSMAGIDSQVFAGTCSNSCEYKVDNSTISNLKVRLLQCSDMNIGEPIPDEELVPFEKYVLGVVYAELAGGNYEALKAQAIAARSYALLRPKKMGGSNGISLQLENGQWILSIRNCTEDQVYCDPDKGCSKNSTNANSTTFSNPDKGVTYKGILPIDSEIRKAVSEVVGKIAVDKDNNYLSTGYDNTVQTAWNEQALNGYDYLGILENAYKGQGFVNVSDGSNCTNYCSTASGDFVNWKQYDPQWKNILMRGTMDNGSSATIGNIGCLLTAVTIQAARSGLPTNVNGEFNPGTVVEQYRNTILDAGGNFIWGNYGQVVPNFYLDGSSNVKINFSTESLKARIAKTQELLNQQCYLVAEVKSHLGGKNQHWVAVDSISEDNINIMDPGSKYTVLWGNGKNYNLNKLRCLRVKGE